MSATAPVLVIGDALLDVRAAPAAPLERGSDTPARIDLLPGGQGANVAVRLARRGVPVTLVTAMGDDRAGRLLREALAVDGVDLRPLPADATGTVVVLREPRGERTMLSHRPTFAQLLDVEALPPARCIVVSGYLLGEPAAESFAAALRRTGARRVLLGCAVPDERLVAWRGAAAELRPDLLLANRDEALRLAASNAPGVGITDAAGATLSIEGVTVSSVTGAAAPARDTTGAGDAFAAALVAELLEAGWPPPRERMQVAIEAAVTLAGRVARVDGAQARVAGEPPAEVTA